MMQLLIRSTSFTTALCRTLSGGPRLSRSLATIADLLRRKDPSHVESALVSAAQPLSAAISLLDRPGISALVVVDDAQRVLGLVTAHDVIRALRVQRAVQPATGSQIDSAPVRDAMIPADAILYASPSDGLAECAAVMAELCVHHLPVLVDGALQGLVSLHDIAAEMLEPLLGGKAAAVHALARHHSGVRVSQNLHAVPRGVAPLFLRSGAAAHPRATPVGRVSEDAFFALDVLWPGDGSEGATAANSLPLSYLGVADGVGSWRALDVDPRLYARGLLGAAAEFVLRRSASVAAAAAAADAAPESLAKTSPSAHPPSPADVLAAAWEAVTLDKVVGSATVSLVSLDSVHRECG